MWSQCVSVISGEQECIHTAVYNSVKVKLAIKQQFYYGKVTFVACFSPSSSVPSCKSGFLYFDYIQVLKKERKNLIGLLPVLLMKCQHNVKRLPQNQAFRPQRSDSLVEGLLDGKTSQCNYKTSVNELAGAVRPDQSAKSICQEITEVQPGSQNQSLLLLLSSLPQWGCQVVISTTWSETTECSK